MIQCLQINLQRSSTAQSLLQQTSTATGAQILPVLEQNWSQEWGSARKDARSDQLADPAASLDLMVGNVDTKPTYQRINAETVIDVTFHRC
ncbi:Endonuclease/exonuclease/phosphatase [Cinara cedri]|uniref:Endonuclease/exonuclease/phosphatase n=1 Tax=Cinara cedri TaxID=506608 RepID=A0A5E4MFX7_9HEMI|nr:Endonuclease/exonuclease/phosphatase [Cinara cedri]